MACTRTKQRAAYNISFLGNWVRNVGQKSMTFSLNIRYSYLQPDFYFAGKEILLYMHYVSFWNVSSRFSIVWAPHRGGFEIATLEGYWWAPEAQQQCRGQIFFKSFSYSAVIFLLKFGMSLVFFLCMHLQSKISKRYSCTVWGYCFIFHNQCWVFNIGVLRRKERDVRKEWFLEYQSNCFNLILLPWCSMSKSQKMW